MATPDFISDEEMGRIDSPDFISDDEMNSLSQEPTPIETPHPDRSFLESAYGAIQHLGTGALEAGTNIARGLNSIGEKGNQLMDQYLPEVGDALDSIKPDMGSYALPSDQEYADMSRQLETARENIDAESKPNSTLGKAAYGAASGLAEMIPKMTTGIGGFAASSGVEGGLRRYYGETDQGTDPVQAAKYGALGGISDAAFGLVIPTAIQRAVKGGLSVGAIAKEIGIFEAFGIGQVAAEAWLRKAALGDPNAFKGLPEQFRTAMLEAPFMVAMLKVPGAAVGKVRDVRAAREEAQQKAAMDKMRTPPPEVQGPSEFVGPPDPGTVPTGNALSDKIIVKKKPISTLRPEAGSSSYEMLPTDVSRPTPPSTRNPASLSEAYAGRDVSSDQVAMDIAVRRANAELAARESNLSDQSRVNSSRLAQRGSLAEPTVIGGETSPTERSLIVPETYGGARGEADAASMRSTLEDGTYATNVRKGSLPLAPEEAVANPASRKAQALLDRIALANETPKGKELVRNEVDKNGVTRATQSLIDEAQARLVESKAVSAEDLASAKESAPTQEKMSAFSDRLKEIADQEQKALVGTSAKKEFPKTKTEGLSAEVVDLKKSVDELKQNPDSKIQVTAVPALGPEKPAYLEYSDVSKVATNPAEFQLRHDVTGEHGTKNDNKLKGPWDDVKAGPIVVYEPLPENRGIISKGREQVVGNGHHRHEGALERNVPKYMKLVLREADGWKPEDVRIYAAEQNLSQGSTSPIDSATIFRYAKRKFGQEGVDRIKANIGQKGREGRIIGEYASDQLWNAFRNGEIPESNTVRTIAETAPNNEKAQLVGIQAFRDGRSNPIIRERMLDYFSGEKKDPAYNKIVEEIIAQRTASLDHSISALSPLKSESSGKIPVGYLEHKYGKDFASRKSQLLEELSNATEELRRYQKGNWRLDPDLNMSIRREADPIYQEHLARKAKDEGRQEDLFTKREVVTPKQTELAQPTQKSEVDQTGETYASTANKFGHESPEADAALKKYHAALDKNKERGSFTLPGEILGMFKKETDTAKSAVTNPESRRQLLKRFDQASKDGSILDIDAELPLFEKQLRGHGTLGTVGGKVRGFFIKTSEAAKKSPEVRIWYDAAWDSMKLAHATEYDLANKLRPYLDLVNADKVNKYLLIQRRRAANSDLHGEPIAESDANLRTLKFNDNDIAAIKAVRAAMTDAWGKYKDIKIEGAKDKNDAAYGVTEQEAKNYVPFSRFGKWRVEGKSSKGEYAVHFVESEKLAKLKAAEMSKDGYTKIQKGEITDTSSKPYKLPVEFASTKGFTKHLMPAKLVAGETADMKKAIVDYIQNIARYVGHETYQPQVKSAFDALAKNKNTATYDWLAKVNSDFNSPTSGITKGLKGAAYNWFLRFNPGSALMNLTEQATVVAPALRELKTGKPNYWLMAKGNLRAGEWMTKGKLSDPEMDRAVRQAVREGVFQDPLHREILNVARSGKGEIAKERGLFSESIQDLFKASQKLNDITAFTAALEGLKSKGLRGEELTRAAENFLNDIRPPSDKLNAPLALRGAMAIPMTFKGWTLNYMTLLARNLSHKEFVTAAEMLVPLVALGGVGALPLAKELFDTMEHFGIDPRRILKGKLNPYINEGVLAQLMDINVMGKVAPSVGLPSSFLDNPGQALAEMGTGVYGTLIKKGVETGTALWNGDIGKSLETLLPAGAPAGIAKVVNASQAGPDGKEIGLVDKKGVPLLLDKGGRPRPLTFGEKVAVGSGVQPKALADAYSMRRSAYLLNSNDQEKSAYYIKELADARYNRDYQRSQELMRQARADKYKINWNEVLEAVRKRQYGDKQDRLKATRKSSRPEMRNILNGQ